jgi:very-short-patch-repair endonuclease
VKDESLSHRARKLLSFTDNRQDASLQAGHFNDFIEIGILRAALYKAVAAAGETGLRWDRLVDAVFHALNLDLRDYSIEDDVVFQAREDRENALRSVLGYRIYNDLRRGWRINTPNLEQCGLLRIEYRDLDAICARQDLWQSTHPALATASREQRRYILQTFLDYMRRELAIQVESLSKSDQDRIRSVSLQYLKAPWALDEDEKLNYARVLFPVPKPGGESDDSKVNLYVSARGGLGRFLRRDSILPAHTGKLSMEETDDMITQLLDVLRRGGLVERREEGKGGSRKVGFQLKAASMIWRQGDGNTPYRDPIRITRAPDTESLPNAFFKNFYQNVAMHALGLEAREHTAQVSSRVRQDREDRFREGQLPILFCSPTMELGVDIAELNVVNLRNVPPNPANYAQRSGRAGRSGQPALVFTYCGKGRAHDQYFFSRPELMVAGAVAPPQIELGNEELVCSHLHAVWLTETGVSLGTSIKEILDVAGEQPTLALLPHVREALERPQVIERTLRKAEAIFRDVLPILRKTPWFGGEWFEQKAKRAYSRFEEALERWRYLFRSAQSQLELQNRIIRDASRSADDKRRAERLRREAVRQLQLLTNDDATLQSDFYSYRYFASEGFLPGYNFPRLPLSAFIPGRRKSDHDEYLSRPRFLAISEFGPRAVIYHEGSKYEIDRVIFMAEGDEPLTGSIKLCPACGYLHDVREGPGPDLCERCATAMPETMTRLFRMQNVSARRRDRISADEEERQRFGYELLTAVRFADRGSGTSFRTAVVREGDTDLMRFEYGPAATIRRINKGWKRRREGTPPGFLLDVERGKWEKQDTSDEDPDDPGARYTHRVVPFVEDTRNTLIVTPLLDLDAAQTRTFQAALKNAMLAVFQLEDNELYAEALPNWAEPKSLLLYESSEGGAGVLRRLFEEPEAFPAVMRQALELCHFDPDSGEDLLRSPFAEEDCGQACYDCLMSYGNQKDHPFLDRHGILELILRLRNAEIHISPVEAPREDHLRSLKNLCDSDLEKEWLDLLDRHGLNLPDKAQTLFEGCRTRVDFLYTAHSTAIFIDGPAHDAPETAAEDRKKRKCLEDLGYITIGFRYDRRSEWLDLCCQHPSVFGSAKELCFE